MGVVSAAMRFGGINLVNEEWLSNPLCAACQHRSQNVQMAGNGNEHKLYPHRNRFQQNKKPA